MFCNHIFVGFFICFFRRKRKMKDLKTLSDLIKIKSYNNEENIINYIKEVFKDCSKEIRVVEAINGKKNILVGLNTKLENVEPIVLSGHIDTVNADEENYLTNPYELVVKDNKAYGLGVIDMKCFTSSIVDKISEIKELKYPIVLAFTTDEETELKGIECLIEEMKQRDIKPKFTIIGEPTCMKINNISNGCFEYKVEVYGKSCHSSTPQNGINAICIMAKIITFIEELSRKYNNLVMNSNIINGGTIINRIPDFVSMSFDIRTTSMNNYKEAIDLINKKIEDLKVEYKTNIVITKQLEIPPLSCKNKSNITKLASKLGLEVESFSGGCEAGYYESYSGDAILFGVGDISLAHKPNEFMIVDDYYKYNDLLMEMLNEIGDIYYKSTY